ncbi:hypothetical protein XELAEV_18039706mg [Xenopus laevis]|uniref:Secreted protein n=1 Tax=Xenopus laevis TaxID=8355 RepID=A0A974C882_XENLA|nr:hypothetical protein XELAEV_18039706mg [Xenopus laevis]
MVARSYLYKLLLKYILAACTFLQAKISPHVALAKVLRMKPSYCQGKGQMQQIKKKTENRQLKIAGRMILG